MVTRDTAQRGDAQATYFVHIRLALPLPMLPDTPCCHPRCKTAGPSASKDPAMLIALRQGLWGLLPKF
jgi:hypothetical protein